MVVMKKPNMASFSFSPMLEGRVDGVGLWEMQP
ncbi:hypothetical protein COLO4_33641 [Corchorus olitorius]|uniref:Uncharacterized protein n=1 Tax=Corchorus olitorius TaxID=93759 RepID=A0A1R3GSF0_9ROSI|nr:hypothetical protein COLO4_33641 [Corchorus olitorius]